MSFPSSSAAPDWLAAPRRTRLVGRVLRGETWAAVLVVAIPLLAYTNLVLWHFYGRGAVLQDSGMQAALLWHSDLALHLPAALGGQSFFATHVTPAFVMASVVSRVLPLTTAQFFALFMGVAHTLPALAAFRLLRADPGLRGMAGLAMATLLALGFAFDGLALAIARFPHFEMLMVAGICLFLVALAEGRIGAAAAFLALSLSVREDAGLHVFGLLATLAAVRWWRGVPWRGQSTVLGFAAAALCWSVAALAMQRLLFGGQSSFVRIYLGEPAFAHLTLAGVGERLAGWAMCRAYVVAPALVAVGWAVRAREPLIVVGYLAAVPWALLHLFADSPIAGALSGYYAFPFMIAAFFPLVGARLAGRTALPGFALMLAASFLGLGWQYDPARIAFPGSFLGVPFVQQRAVERALQALPRSRPQAGKLTVDQSVASVAPRAYGAGELLADQVAPDTIVWFADGFDAASAAAMAAALPHRYAVTGTPLLIASRRALEAAPALAPLLRPAR